MERSSAHYHNGWIPVDERMPKAEEEVLVCIKGYRTDIITSAIYEDGEVRENESVWNWQDIDGEWDEDEDCYIIPEGWWEYRHFNPDDIYNNVIDREVTAWMPLPDPYVLDTEYRGEGCPGGR